MAAVPFKSLRGAETLAGCAARLEDLEADRLAAIADAMLRVTLYPLLELAALTKLRRTELLDSARAARCGAQSCLPDS
jgi:hypothetical protein